FSVTGNHAENSLSGKLTCRECVDPGQNFPLNTGDIRLEAETEVFLVIGITCVAIALLVFWVEPLSIVGVLERLTPNVQYRVRTNRPFVALSFDDGPHQFLRPKFWRFSKLTTPKPLSFLSVNECGVTLNWLR